MQNNLTRNYFLQFQKQLENMWESSSFDELLIQVGKQLFTEKKKLSDWKVEDRDGHGLYAFWIEKENLLPYEQFVKNWNKTEERKLSQPFKKWYNHEKAKQTPDGQFLFEQGDFRCFYMGKREQVFHRISDHLKARSKSTYGLHLDRKGLDLKDKLYVGYWLIPESDASEEYIDPKTRTLVKQHLISYLESELRYYLSPMVGKQ